MRLLALALVGALLSHPSYAFYQEMTCERNTATGAMELDAHSLPGARQWDGYRIVAEKDVGLTPRPAMSHRPGWVFGTCIVEGHWSRIPEDAPVRFPRQ